MYNYREPQNPDLREYRLHRNLSVAEVLIRLDHDYRIRTKDKTLYGWEENHTLPVPSTFMAICRIYEIHYPNARKVHASICTTESSSFCLTEEELHMIQICRLYPDRLKEAIRELL